MRGALVFVLASLTVACGAGAEESITAPAELDMAAGVSDVPAESTIRAEEARTPGPSRPAPASPRGFVCRKGAFCDDFEAAVPGARWHGSSATSGGAIDFVTPSSTPGARSMRAIAPSSDARAFLVLEGTERTSVWAGAFGFSIRLDALPETALGGPQIVVPTSEGETSITVSMRPEGIVLEQRKATGATPQRADVIALAADGWRRVVIGIEASGEVPGPAGSRYGRVEVSVDGGDNLDVPLMVSPFGGKLQVRAGITSADTSPATARIDDVMFFTR